MLCVKIKVNSLFRADACREITMIMYASANVWWKKTNKDSGCARDLYLKGTVNPNSCKHQNFLPYMEHKMRFIVECHSCSF